MSAKKVTKSSRRFATPHIYTYSTTRTPAPANNKTPPALTTVSEEEAAFSKLELFLSAFPGTEQPNGGDRIDGFTELRETFIRTIQFFWPKYRHQLRITAVLDDNLYRNEEEKQSLIAKFQSLFFFYDDDDDHDNEMIGNSTSSNTSADVSSNTTTKTTTTSIATSSKLPTTKTQLNIAFNPRSNSSLYGSGWYMQQLIMFWADNFTDAEYIGFVDDDTLVTRAIVPHDLFDEKGRPRVIGNLPRAGVKEWMEASEYTFKRKAYVYTMTYFPVVIKTEHIRKMREEILKLHPEHGYFDEFYLALIHRKYPQKHISSFSQFCIMMEYLFQYHQEEYDWHFESSPPAMIEEETSTTPHYTREMFKPFPRVSIHGSYLFMAVKKLRHANTVNGRNEAVTNIMKEGYCYSLPKWNATDVTARHCARYNVDSQCFDRGQWRFEQYPSFWYLNNSTEACAVHKRRMQLNPPDHLWNKKELQRMFGY
jgi:hypothetical protein